MFQKRILVTGANKGIGRAICLKLLMDYPDTMVLLGSRDKQRGDEAVAQIVEELISKNIPDVEARIASLSIDIANEESVINAAMEVNQKYTSIYGLVNNAGVGWGNPPKDIIDVNYYGTKRVISSFLPLVKGRIVNISSAAGPMYVAKRTPEEQEFYKSGLVSDEEVESKIVQLLSNNPNDSDSYGISKACVNILTMQTAISNPSVCILACTPGFIATDLTKGFGATLPPEAGTKAPLFCLFDESVTSGFYYGSDAVRSPLDKYRGPGDPAYQP
eukprot:gene11611-15549_t